MADSKGGGCLKGTAVGCGSCFVLCLVLAVSVWAGWGTIRDIGPFKKIRTMVDSAKDEAKNLGGLKASLQEKYPAVEIGAQANFNSVNGHTTRTLGITIVDPKFALPGSETEKEALAREIALTVAGSYETIDRYDEIRLSIVEHGGGASLGSSSDYRFAIPELLPAAKPRP